MLLKVIPRGKNHISMLLMHWCFLEAIHSKITLSISILNAFQGLWAALQMCYFNYTNLCVYRISLSVNTQPSMVNFLRWSRRDTSECYLLNMIEHWGLRLGIMVNHWVSWEFIWMWLVGLLLHSSMKYIHHSSHTVLCRVKHLIGLCCVESVDQKTLVCGDPSRP